MGAQNWSAKKRGEGKWNLSFSITDVLELREIIQQRPTCKCVPTRQSYIIQDTGIMNADEGKLLQFMEATMQKGMFRLLRRCGIWGTIKSELCDLTSSAAFISQELQDYQHNCKKLIMCIFISWMPIFSAWMSTSWRNLSCSLAEYLAH